MSTPVPVRLHVNGDEHQLEVEPRLLLVHALRDDLELVLDAVDVQAHRDGCAHCLPPSSRVVLAWPDLTRPGSACEGSAATAG
jgi:hypothetical protein